LQAWRLLALANCKQAAPWPLATRGLLECAAMRGLCDLGWLATCICSGQAALAAGADLLAGTRQRNEEPE